MRLSSFRLTATIALLASVAASSRSTFEGLTASDQNEAQQSLRDGADASQDERGFNDMIGLSKKFVSKPSPQTTPSQIDDINFEHFLKLENADNLLSTPEFKQWEKFTLKKNGDNVNAAAAAIVAALSKKFDAYNFVKMLDTASKVEETKYIATRLQRAQIDFWRSQHKAANDLFHTMFPPEKLEEVGDNLLSTPQFDSWATYVSKTTDGYPEKEMLEVLETKLSNDHLVMMLDASSKIAGPNDIATRLQRVQKFKSWASYTTSAEDAFASLKLEADEKLLSTQQFKMWADYVTMTNKDPEVVMATVLAEKYGDHVLVKMLEASGTELIATKIQLARKMQSWISHKASADDVFASLKLKADDKLLSTPEFDRWAKYVSHLNEDDPEAAMVEVLAKKYGDAGFVQMLEVSGAKLIATKLELALKMVSWTKRKTSAKDAFASLKLKDDDTLLSTPEFGRWAKYVTLKNNDDPDAVMAAVLAENYGENVIVKLLDSASEVDSTKDIATRLQEGQMRYWIHRRKSANDAFAYFGLNENIDNNVLSTPHFERWTKYVTQRNNNDPEEAMAAVLATYPDQYHVVKLLDTASKVEETKHIATRLQEEQMKYWTRQKKSAIGLFSDLFTSEKLQELGDNLLSTPQFGRWATYVSKTTDGYPEKEMLEVMARKLSNDHLVMMLDASSKIAGPNDIATRLQRVQKWESWTIHKTSAEDAFASLKLEADEKLLSTQQFKMWADYVTMTNKDPEVVMATVLAEKYGDHVLVKMLEASGTELIATKIQLARKMQSWISHKASADDVFASLKLKADDKLLSTPEFDRWAKYVSHLNEDDPEAAMVEILAKKYGDAGFVQMLEASSKDTSTQDIATRLQLVEKMESWTKSKTSAEDAFASLELKADEKLLSTPEFDRWAKYVATTTEGDTDKAMVVIAAILVRKYDAYNLQMMKNPTWEVAGTKDIASKLRSSWDAQVNAAEGGFVSMELQKAGDGLLSTSQFLAWSKHVSEDTAGYPDAAMEEVLLRHYEPDDFAMMLEAAIKVDETKEIATRLQKAQLDTWYFSGFITIEYTFEALKVGSVKAEELLASPAFNIFFKYATLHNVDDSTDLKMFQVITRHYENDEVTKIFATTPVTKEIHEKLQRLRRGRNQANGGTDH